MKDVAVYLHLEVCPYPVDRMLCRTGTGRNSQTETK